MQRRMFMPPKLDDLTGLIQAKATMLSKTGHDSLPMVPYMACLMCNIVVRRGACLWRRGSMDFMCSSSRSWCALRCDARTPQTDEHDLLRLYRMEASRVRRSRRGQGPAAGAPWRSKRS